MATRMQLTKSRTARKSIRRPTLGVYLDRPPLDLDPRALQDCLNIRIKDKKISSDAMGWENFPQSASNSNRINLDYLQTLFIGRYFSQSGAQTLIFANKRDIFRFNPLAGPPATVTYMTPIYAVGTASCAGATKTIVGAGGCLWNTAKTTLPVAGGYGKNVKAGYFISFGSATQTSPAATWYKIDTVTDDTHLELLVQPGVVASGPYTIRQVLTGDNLDAFDAETFKDAQDSSPPGLNMYYMTNGIEMLEWDGSSAQMTWFYPGFVCRGFVTYKQTLLAYYIIESGETKSGTIKYSRQLYPRNFSTLGAGEITPSDGVSPLLNIMPIGDQVALYYNRDIILAQYVGPPLIYVARVAVPDVGLAAKSAIMDFGDFHVFLSADSAYSFDGVGIEEHGQQIFREVLRKSAPGRISRAYAHIDEENGEVIWSIPLTTDGQTEDAPPVIAYVEHYLEDVGPSLPVPMTIREFPFTATGFYEATASKKFSDFGTDSFASSALKWDDRAYQDAFPFNIVGSPGGDIYIINTTNSQNGAAIDSYAVFPRSALGDGEYKGLVHRIEPYTTRRAGASEYTLNVKVQIFDFADGDVIDSEEAEFDLTHQGLRYVPIRKSGRYGDVRFGTNGINTPWDVAGFEVKVSAMGSR